MTARRRELATWGAAVLLLGSAAGAWRLGSGPAPDSAPAIPAAPSLVARIAPESLAAVATRVVEGDPFRLERRPAAVAFDPALEGMPAPPPPPPKPPKPALTLAGVLGGPPWEALLEGIPGRDGSVVVRQGDRVGALTIRAVRRDTVIVRGMDTTWTLTVRRAWR